MKTFVVAEIASNWEGNIAKAKKLILESKKAGADAVKFQMWKAKDLYSSNHPNWDIIKKSELSFTKAKKLKNFSDDIGMEFFCSAFYPEAVDFLEKINVKKYKVASRTCLFKDPLSFETLIKEAETKKSIIISMGMGGNIRKIKKIFLKNETIFCYCISEYPTPFNKINWRKALNYNGFSDHTVGLTAPILFTILKKYQGSKSILIEKHVKLKNTKGPDAETSIDTEQLRELILHLRLIENVNL